MCVAQKIPLNFYHFMVVTATTLRLKWELSDGMGSVCACCACRSSILCYIIIIVIIIIIPPSEKRGTVWQKYFCYEKNFCVRYLVQLTVFIAPYSLAIYLDWKINLYARRVCVGGQKTSQREMFLNYCVLCFII